MAFHPYPQLIRWLFNARRFGPPAPVTAPSPWPWIDHSVSRLPRRTARPYQTRFRYGFPCYMVNLARQEQLVGSLYKRHAVTLLLLQPLIGGVSLARNLSAPLQEHCFSTVQVATELRPLVSARFQVLFHSPSRRSFHLSLTVLVHYRSYSCI